MQQQGRGKNRPVHALKRCTSMLSRAWAQSTAASRQQSVGEQTGKDAARYVYLLDTLVRPCFTGHGTPLHAHTLRAGCLLAPPCPTPAQQRAHQSCDDMPHHARTCTSTMALSIWLCSALRSATYSSRSSLAARSSWGSVCVLGRWQVEQRVGAQQPQQLGRLLQLQLGVCVCMSREGRWPTKTQGTAKAGWGTAAATVDWHTTATYNQQSQQPLPGGSRLCVRGARAK